MLKILFEDKKNIEINDVVEKTKNSENIFQKLFNAIEAINLALIGNFLNIAETLCAKFPTLTSVNPLINSIGFLRTEIAVIIKINKLTKMNGIIIVPKIASA
ncbi:Uncharacterised protein [Chlamydia trachomatis]|nr:Uncharacterised protein [Chlamydia trachomatis]